MPLRFSVLACLLICSTALFAQRADTTLRWADRLLLQEIPYPVTSRLTRSSATALPVLNRLADAALQSRDFPLADSLIAQTTSLTHAASGRELAYAHFNRARLAYELSDYSAAAKAGNDALQLLPVKSVEPLALRQRVELLLAKIYIQQKQLKQAQPLLSGVLDFFGKDSVRYAIPLAQTCFALGLWHKNNGDWQPALTYYTRAARLFEADSHERYYDLGRCYNNLGTVYNEQGNYGQARTWYTRALQVKRKYNTDSVSLAVTYNNMGAFYANFGNLYQAREHYEKSLALLNPRDVRTHERQAQFLNNYATLLMETDEQDAAEKNLRKSLQLLRESGATGEPLLAPSISLAGLLTVRGDVQAAAGWLESAGSILADSQSTRRMVALWHLRHADLLNRKGDLPVAGLAYAQAWQQVPANTVLAAEVLQHRGELALKQMNADAALTYFRQSGAIITRIKSATDPQLCSTFNSIAAAFLHQHALDSAIYYLQLAVERNLAAKPGQPAQLEAVFPFELISSFYLLSQSYLRRYKVSSQPTDLKQSVTYTDLGLRAIDARRKTMAMTNDQLTFDDRVAAFFEQAMEVYWTLQRTDNSPTAAGQLFYIAELAKSQSLGQLLRTSNLQSFSNVTATLQREEERLRNKIQTLDMQSLYNARNGTAANADLTREYQQELTTTAARYERLQDSIRQNLPGYYQMKYNKTLVTPTDIRQDILANEPNTALLQFTMGDSAVYGHVLTPTSSMTFKVGRASDVRNHILGFRNQIKLMMEQELYTNAAWLYDQLLRPAEALWRSGKNPVTKLIIIPDQILCYLPFEALIRTAGTTQFLVNELDISYAYSATLLWQKYKEKNMAPLSGAFVGLAPAFTASDSRTVSHFRDDGGERSDRFQFQPLEGNRTEVNAIGQGLSKRNVRSTVLEGDQATEASFRKLNLRNFDYIHLATHSFVDMDNPQRSGVAFSRNDASQGADDILFTREVYEMQFNARMVCLSSCESGLGKLYRGEGMIGLAQAFLFAGARNLAVSLWKVDDSATRDLMIDFYSRLPAASLSNGLATAKRNMARSKAYRHPYYWASFILVGI